MIDLRTYEVWFVTGSQHLYGPKTLEAVAEHSREISGFLGASTHVPVKVVFKPVLTTPEDIRRLCLAANENDSCIGLITWMHTFSPAKMWIAGLTLLRKPILHLHTQYNQEIPWAQIDMDFMNLNQAAHGDREYAFHRQPAAAEPQSGRGTLEGRSRAGGGGRLDACRLCLVRLAGRKDRVLWG